MLTCTSLHSDCAIQQLKKIDCQEGAFLSIWSYRQKNVRSQSLHPLSRIAEQLGKCFIPSGRSTAIQNLGPCLSPPKSGFLNLSSFNSACIWVSFCAPVLGCRSVFTLEQREGASAANCQSQRNIYFPKTFCYCWLGPNPRIEAPRDFCICPTFRVKEPVRWMTSPTDLAWPWNRLLKIGCSSWQILYSSYWHSFQGEILHHSSYFQLQNFRL